MQLGECTAVPQNTHPPACPSRYLVLAFKIFLAPIRAQHMASRLQPDKPRGYRFHARTAHHSHRRRHPLLQPRQHQLLQHHPHALPCPKKITVARSAGQTTLRAHIASPARPCLHETRTEPTASFIKSTIVPKVTRRETVDAEPTPFFCFNSHTLPSVVSIPLGLSGEKNWRETLFLCLVQIEINLFALLSICTKRRKVSLAKFFPDTNQVESTIVKWYRIDAYWYNPDPPPLGVVNKTQTKAHPT